MFGSLHVFGLAAAYALFSCHVIGSRNRMRACLPGITCLFGYEETYSAADFVSGSFCIAFVVYSQAVGRFL